jgi:hypothetical protein
MPARNSAANRDLPTPAEPSTVKSWQERSCTACANASRSRRNSVSRPTIGVAKRRASSPCAEISRNAGTGSLLPFSDSGSTASASTASRASASVSAPISTSPGAAACSSRAATLTASPVASRSAVPVTTSPVVTPIRPLIPKSGKASRISTAARQARSASSSCSTGTPKTAITASPMNFSTVPPWASTIPFIRSKYRASRARSASGSFDSPSAVEPVTSQNSTVTVFRCSREGAVVANGAAQ